MGSQNFFTISHPAVHLFSNFKCILTSLTFHILTLGCVLKVQGDSTSDVVIAGAKHSEADSALLNYKYFDENAIYIDNNYRIYSRICRGLIFQFVSILVHVW